MVLFLFLYLVIVNLKTQEIMTLQDLINHAEKTGKRFEINYPHSVNDKYAFQSFEFEVGIELERHVWFWFEAWDYEKFNRVTFSHEINTDNPELRFRSRYNQANGATIRSIGQEMKAEKIILS